MLNLDSLESSESLLGPEIKAPADVSFNISYDSSEETESLLNLDSLGSPTEGEQLTESPDERATSNPVPTTTVEDAAFATPSAASDSVETIASGLEIETQGAGVAETVTALPDELVATPEPPSASHPSQPELAVLKGSPQPLGPSLVAGDGASPPAVNFALYSNHGTAVTLCL